MLQNVWITPGIAKHWELMEYAVFAMQVLRWLDIRASASILHPMHATFLIVQDYVNRAKAGIMYIRDIALFLLKFSKLKTVWFNYPPY
jgi:hypothetical protein